MRHAPISLVAADGGDALATTGMCTPPPQADRSERAMTLESREKWRRRGAAATLLLVRVSVGVTFILRSDFPDELAEEPGRRQVASRLSVKHGSDGAARLGGGRSGGWQRRSQSATPQHAFPRRRRPSPPPPLHHRFCRHPAPLRRRARRSRRTGSPTPEARTDRGAASVATSSSTARVRGGAVLHCRWHRPSSPPRGPVVASSFIVAIIVDSKGRRQKAESSTAGHSPRRSLNRDGPPIRLSGAPHLWLRARLLSNAATRSESAAAPIRLASS